MCITNKGLIALFFVFQMEGLQNLIDSWKQLFREQDQSEESIDAFKRKIDEDVKDLGEIGRAIDEAVEEKNVTQLKLDEARAALKLIVNQLTTVNQSSVDQSGTMAEPPIMFRHERS